MMVVEYMANIWHLLLSPMSYFEMQEDAKWTAYRNQIGLPASEQEVSIMMAGSIAWALLIDASVVEKRQPLLCSLDLPVMAGINEATEDIIIFDLLVGTKRDAWDLYCTSVKSIFNVNISKKPFETKEERKVQKMMQCKWEVVKFDHGGNHFQCPLPLLTPKIVEGLAELMARIPHALTEVRVFAVRCALFDVRPLAVLWDDGLYKVYLHHLIVV